MAQDKYYKIASKRFGDYAHVGAIEKEAARLRQLAKDIEYLKMHDLIK